ncbi:hypothetical protein IWW50_001273 [Coemansia erecta]|nr:hypothetical protein GGF43_002218 [Coemansia sp. RSA 2618]KAJ2828651.1 hypothetical protein IWW50_001273 [Coemansia erecta]
MMHSGSQPESAETSREPPGGNEGPGDSEAVAPLELARTITIDEIPKVARDQMDIHYRIPQSQSQYRQHVMNLQTPSALRGPGHSHLYPDAPMRSLSTQELAEPEPPAASRAEHPKAVRVASRYAETHSESDLAALQHGLRQRSPDEQSAASQQAPSPGSRTPGESDTDGLVLAGESDTDGLVLAADEEILSQHVSRATTRQTVASNPEATGRLLSASDLDLSPVSRRVSLPVAAPHASAPGSHIATPELAVHPDAGTPAMHHHALDLGHVRSRPRRRRSNAGANVRRLRRRRRPADDVDAIGGPACEFIGNRRNPLGRLDDGELVDYDDPNDEDLEVSFMENNVDDRLIDYLTVDLGGGIRRLRSILPSIGRRTTDHNQNNP